MTTATIPQTVLFPDLFEKPLVATFDQQHASSDGGAILLPATDRRYGLIDGVAAALGDDRQPAKIRHTLRDLLAQRIFGLACGHADANDADRLADDPIHKLLVGRDPIAGAPLGSQPTISRFENGVGVQELFALGAMLATRVIDRHRRRLRGRARRITIDLDPTDDPTHGAQQLTFFNGHYDTWCYLPLLASLTFDDEAEQYLCAAVLRPGNVPASRGAEGVLCRLLARLRGAFPQARFRVRLDGGFATPEILDWLDAEPRLDYVVAMAEDRVLTRHAESAMVEGDRVYSKLRYESGVHRVQRVPATEASGRIHTSAVTVAVLPEAEEVDVKIEAKDLRIDTFCSSGPGGQSVNTTYSAVRITHLPTNTVVSCQDEKSQIKNREKAMKVLRARLYEVALAEQQKALAADRKSQVGSGDRSEKIRTYNFPQNRVTDHRVDLTLYKLDEVLEGDLDELIEALALAEQAERIAG